MQANAANPKTCRRTTQAPGTTTSAPYLPYMSYLGQHEALHVHRAVPRVCQQAPPWQPPASARHLPSC